MGKNSICYLADSNCNYKSTSLTIPSSEINGDLVCDNSCLSRYYLDSSKICKSCPI
jgi:hypothetical protein